MNGNIWSDMFLLSLPVLEKIFRVILVYVFLVVGLRLAGKRELAQLNTFDLVVLLTLSNTVQNAIIGNDNSVTGGLVGAATLLAINYVVVRYLYGHEHVDHIVEGSPDRLIVGGKVLKDRLEKEVITLEELESAAHKQGFASLDEVKEAILEPGGALTFIAKQPSIEQRRQRELVMRLERIERMLEEMKAARSA